MESHHVTATVQKLEIIDELAALLELLSSGQPVQTLTLTKWVTAKGALFDVHGYHTKSIWTLIAEVHDLCSHLLGFA